MAYGRISKKQQEILDYIKNEILNRGFPPAVREICEAVHLKSTSSVHSHLEALEKNGYIRRDATKPRAIEIIDDNFNLARREVVNVPLVGTVAAGQPILALENIETYFPVPAEFMPNEQSFMLRVKGDSMVNAGIFDGDQVLVKQQTSAKPLTRVIIDKDLNYYAAFGNDKEQALALDELTPFLQSCAAKEPEMYVALYADESVPYREIVKVLNIANENHFKMVLATRPPENK